MVAASTRSSKTGLGHCGLEPGMDCIGPIVKTECSPATRKTRAYLAALFRGFWKTSSAVFGSAPRKEYLDSIPRRKHLETTTWPTACKAMSSVKVPAHKAQTARCSLVAVMD